MANFSRLIRVITYFGLGVAISFCWIISSAVADTIPAVTAYKATWDDSSRGSQYCNHCEAATVQEICNWSYWAVGATGVAVQISGVNYCQQSVTHQNYLVNVIASCPAGNNWTLSGSVCSRPDCIGAQFHSLENGQCVCVVKQPSVQSYTVPAYSPTRPATALDAPTCSEGCEQLPAAVLGVTVAFCPGAVISTFTGGVTTCFAKVGQTGSACTLGGLTPGAITLTLAPSLPADVTGTSADGSKLDGKNTTANATDAVICGEAGGVYGMFNGVGKCLTPSVSNPLITVKDSVATVANSDTSVNTKKTEATTDTGPGSVKSTTTATTVTTCVGVACTTTSGSSTGAEKTEKPTTFCEENPKSAICIDSSFSGACASGPVCTGDAVQCAQANEIFRLRCAMTVEGPASVLGVQATSGADPMAGTLPDPAHPAVVDVGGLVNTSGWLGRACLADLPFSVMGHDLVVPFSKLCPALGAMGLAVLLFAGVGAIKIVSGGRSE